MKLPIFLNAIKNGSLNVLDFGEIIYSGWGENPPPEITSKMKIDFT